MKNVLTECEVFFDTHTKIFAIAMSNDEQLVVCRNKTDRAYKRAIQSHRPTD